MIEIVAMEVDMMRWRRRRSKRGGGGMAKGVETEEMVEEVEMVTEGQH